MKQILSGCLGNHEQWDSKMEMWGGIWNQAKTQETGSLLVVPPVPITQGRGIKTLWFHCEILCSYTSHWFYISQRPIFLESYHYRKTGPFTLFSGIILFFFRYPIIFRTNFVIFCVCQSSTHPGCIVLSLMTDSLPQRWIPLRGQQGGLLRITWMKKIFLPHWADHHRPWGQCTIAVLSHWKAREFILSWGNESLVSQHVHNTCSLLSYSIQFTASSFFPGINTE